MKCFMVGIMLVGSVFSQTKQSGKASTPSKQSSIQIGMDLQLGMSRDAIITQLTANYKVEKLQGKGDDWFVADKGSPTTWIGVLGFHEGKLTYASSIGLKGRKTTMSSLRRYGVRWHKCPTKTSAPACSTPQSPTPRLQR